MKRNERVLTILYLLGGIAIVIGPVMFLFMGVFLRFQTPEVSQSAVTGTVQCEPKTQMTISEPVCFGFRKIDGVRSNIKSRYASLKKESLGNPQILIATENNEVKEAILPERGRKGWRRCRVERKEFSTLAQFNFELKTKKTFPNYSISEWGVRPGQTLTLLFGPDGKTVSELWCGTPEDHQTARSVSQGLMFVVFGALAVGFVLLGLVLISAAFWMSRRTGRRTPADSGDSTA